MYDWNDLRYFVAVARAGSTLAAAKALGLNQSTVQRRLAALEKQIGHRLFARHPTGYRLTQFGDELLPHAERVEQAAAALERHVTSNGDALSGTVRVTCPESVAYRMMMTPLLDIFRRRYPNLKVDLVMTDRLVDLQRGEADVAIRAGKPGDETLVGRKLVDIPWAVYASRAYAAQHEAPKRAEDLNGHSVVAFDGAIADLPAAHWLRSQAPRATIVARSNSLGGVVLALKSGGGLAPLPTPLADHDDELVRVLGPISKLTSQFFLLTHPDLRHTPRIRAFLDFVVAHIDTIRPLLLGEKPSAGVE